MKAAINFILALVITLVLTGRQALAFVDASLVGGLSVASQSITTSYNVNSSSKTYLAFGALGNARFIGVPWGLTSGILYVEMGSNQRSQNGIDQRNYDVKVPYLQVPIIIDYWILKNLLVGLGGYIAFPGGNVKTTGTQTFFTTSSIDLSQSFSAANYRELDWGAVAHAQVKFPFGRFFGTAALIYEYGFEDVNALADITTRNSAFLALIGGGITF
jgi:hypothetical protein